MRKQLSKISYRKCRIELTYSKAIMKKKLKNTLHNDKVSGREEGLMNMAAENWRKILRSVEKEEERNATCTRQKEKKYTYFIIVALHLK